MSPVAASAVAIPSIPLPSWVWLIVLTAGLLIAVGLGVNAAKHGNIGIMIIALLIGAVLGGGATAYVLTSSQTNASSDVVQRLESQYQVRIRPEASSGLMAPTSPNGSTSAVVTTPDGTNLSCYIVSGESEYEVLCEVGDTLRPLNAAG